MCVGFIGIKSKDTFFPFIRIENNGFAAFVGVTRRVLRPEPTVSQLKEQKAKAEQAKQRLQEQENQRQRDIALAIRYPNLEAHAKARRDALESSQLRMGLIEKRLQALQQKRNKLQKRSMCVFRFLSGKVASMPRVYICGGALSIMPAL